MKHRIAATARAIGSKMRRRCDLGFFGDCCGAGFGAGFGDCFGDCCGDCCDVGCLKKAYTFVTALFNFMLPRFVGLFGLDWLSYVVMGDGYEMWL